ncbi:uncharacterized protein LOC129411973 isoform X2 [Boleophthalmus pectinirostris]|uniref:uncharacterized protein LOC129411973 isoform X2 n=1 Tax=Boleophthalmus pectinirostris TaxID=150288 RepID=UPI002432DAFE|nr:uncharacterized protein LOC129411973 isoform X2 [Boleophthalmus pectinirostris]
MEVKDSSVKMTVIKKRNILVETTGRRAEKDRYSLQFDEWTNIMTVGIKKVQLSDSGQYKCKLERTGPDGHETFQISVLKVRPTQRPGPSPDPGFDPDPDPSPSLNPNSTIRPEHELQSEAPHRSSQTGSVLYIGVTLAVILMIFSVVLLIFYCKKKENKPTEFAVNRELGEVPEGDREYEEVPERQVQSTSDRGSDIYSLASAPAHTQVDSGLYSEVADFSRNSAPHSRAEAVIYSAVQTQDTPLYSNISALQ